MENVVLLKFQRGDFDQGFDVILRIGSDTEIEGHFPAAPNIPAIYKSWHSDYLILENLRGKDTKQSGAINNTEPEKQYYQETQGSKKLKKPQAINNTQLKEQCRQKAEELRNSMRTWLSSQDKDLQKFREKLLQRLPNKQEEIRVIIQSKIHLLKQIPWQEWDLFSDVYTNSEIALSPPEHYPVSRLVPARHKNQVKILVILGDNEEIKIEDSRQLIKDLPNAYPVFVANPQRRELTNYLWEQNWDILFFTGHSSNWGKTGRISINSTENLTIGDLKRGLKKAIERGLRIAIFNSCDGLGLARELEDLHIPQIIVMREPVSDNFAQEFLKHFLTAFSSGKSLYLAVRQARDRLRDEGLENESPGVTWLPVICQNPAEAVLTWQELASGNIESKQAINTKEQIMNNHDNLITHFESENGLDFINNNHQKSSEIYTRLFNTVYEKLKIISMESLLTELQQQPTDINKSVFLKILKSQIVADKEFTNKLIDIVKQLESADEIRTECSSAGQTIISNYGHTQVVSNVNHGHQTFSQ